MVQSEKFKSAFSMHRNGQLTQACDLYKEILKSEPENDEVWDLLGVLYCQAERFDEAEDCILKAIEIRPLIYYISNLAQLYLKKGDFPAAIKYYGNLISGKGDNYENRFNLAMAYKNNNELDKAEKAYYKAIDLKPESHEAYFNLAAVYIAQNNPHKAIEAYK